MGDMVQLEIRIFEAVGGNAAVSSDDGETVFRRSVPAFDNGKKVVLDFAGIELITSTFLNASVGQLYGKYDHSFIKQNITVVNMSNDDLALLSKVVERAKIYFSDPRGREQIERSFDKAING